MEVCVDCVQSACNAEAGGASRLELCSALSEGGLTPTVGLLKTVKSLVKIPVYSMIRPRRGLDFMYSPEELNVMEIDILSLKAAGADGFVFGVLKPSKNIDESACSRLLKLAAPLPCTCHRAFDMTKDTLNELETIISLGFQRILTSGHSESATSGVKLIKELVKKSQDRIIIMPGAGILEDNLEYILKETGVKEFHASARSGIKIGDCDNSSTNVTMGASDSDSTLLVTDTQMVKKMVEISKRVWIVNTS